MLIPIKFPLESSNGPPLPQFQETNQHSMIIKLRRETRIIYLWHFERQEYDNTINIYAWNEKKNLENLFPGLIAASVWIPPPIVTPVWLNISRLRPLITPTVRVWSKPNGFPMAKHCWPTFREEEPPTFIGLNRSPEASTWRVERQTKRT